MEASTEAISHLKNLQGGRQEIMNFIDQCTPAHLQKEFAQCRHDLEHDHDAECRPSSGAISAKSEPLLMKQAQVLPPEAKSVSAEVAKQQGTFISEAKSIFHKMYTYLVEVFESIQPKLVELLNSAIPDWERKALDFIVTKTTELIEFITGFHDEKKIKAIVKCTGNYILCVVKALTIK